MAREDRIQELVERLSRLPCLAQPTKMFIAAMAMGIPEMKIEGWTEQQIDDYLATRLTFVEENIAIVDHPRFLDTCQQLGSLKPDQLVAALKGEGQPDANFWFQMAIRNEVNPVVCLFCAANFYASIPPSAEIPPKMACMMLRCIAVPIETFGHMDRSVSLLEAFADIKKDDYFIPEALAAKTTKLREKIGTDGVGILIMTLANTLGFTNRLRESVSILQHIGSLDAVDYEDPTRLTAKFQKLRSEIDADQAATFAQTLANALRFTNRPRECALVLERFAGLSESDYDDPARLAKALEILRSELEANNAANFAQSLADALSFTNRPRECALVLERFAGLRESDYDDPGRLAKALEILRSELEANNAATFSQTLANALRFTNRLRECALVLERFAGLSESDYNDPARLAEALEILRSELTADNAATFALTLAGALRQTNRPRECALVLDRFAGLSESDYNDPARLAEALEKLRGELTANNAAVFAQTLADALRFTNRPRECALVLERFAGLSESDYDDPARLAEALEKLRSELEANNAATFARALADALRQTSRPHESALVLDAAFGEMHDLDADVESPVLPQNLSSVVLTKLRVVGYDEQRQASTLTLCRRYVAFLGRTVGDPSLSRGNAQLLMKAITPLRRKIIEVAQYWADRQPDPALRAAARRQATEWAAELKVGWLALRSRLETFRYGDDGASLKMPDWVVQHQPPLRSGHLPPYTDDPAAANAMHLSAFRAVEDARIVQTNADQPAARLSNLKTGAAEPQMELVAEPLPMPAWLDEATRFLRRNVRLDDFRKLLGNKTVLLQAGFHADGRLWWNAYRSGEESVDLVQCGTLEGNTQTELRWTAARHDLAIELVWQTYAEHLPVWIDPNWGREVDEALEKIIAGGELGQRAAFFQALQTLPNHAVEKGGAVVWNGVAAVLYRLFDSLMIAPADDDQKPEWASETLQQWQRVRELVVRAPQLAEKLPAKENGTTCRDWLRTRLDAATRQFLENIESVWCPNELNDILTEDVDLVFEVEDALHAIPIAFLRVGGKYLWQRVASVSAWLSPWTMVIGQQLEQRQQDTGTQANTIVSHSWFESDDPCGHGAARLHGGAQWLASQRDFDWRGAGDMPQGSMSNLVRNLGRLKDDERAALVAFVCGHGWETQHGVKLSEQLWRGSGLDLSDVEFLILVSCSVGRSFDTGGVDVEGLAIQLALHRCRSVLAARWPIHCLEAPDFATEVAQQYLDLRQQVATSEVSKERIRARAVNQAQHVFLDGDQPHVGWNTIAAFDLYGLR